jgi:hypothetical protein
VKRLNSFALCALMTPAITLGMGAVLAQEQHAPAAHYLTSKPASAFRVDQLIGSNLKSTVDGENIGSINDVVIDADGQILGVTKDALTNAPDYKNESGKN